MTGEANKPQADLDSFLRRERLWRRFTWLATLPPIALFILFVYLSAREMRNYQGLSQKNSQLEAQIEEKKVELEQRKKDLATQGFALSLVRENSTGPRPRIVFYRASVADQINQALGQLGYEVTLSDYRNPAVQYKPVDTLEYGCGVTAEDIRLIGTALLKGGLPVRRIAPAVNLKDPLLVQYIATKYTDSAKNSLSPEQILSWTRTTKPCQVSGKVKSVAQARH